MIKANALMYQYDHVGNMLRAYKTGTSSDERTLTWTPFNKPSVIRRNGNEVEFRYDANHNRYLKKSSDGTETFYFGKTYERIVNAKTGETQHKHFVYADGKLIALNTQIRDKENKLKNKQVRYLHYDALNSVDMITDGYGNVVERQSYDTWGKQRKVLWRSSASELIQEVITNRGYTGHEEIKEVGLIHMNGRVYDQELGRFLSADPHIQAPFLVNSFNRYSYVMNNPLKYVDPTGFRWSEYSTSVSYSGNNVTVTAHRNNSGYSPNYSSKDRNNDRDNFSSKSKSKVEKTKTVSVANVSYNDINHSPSVYGFDYETYGIIGTIEPIQGRILFGFAKLTTKNVTFDIVYGHISSISALNADPVDDADMGAYKKAFGLFGELLAGGLLPTSRSAVLGKEVLEGVTKATIKEITKSSRKRLKRLIKDFSDNSRQNNGLSQGKIDQLRRIVEKAGGKLRNDGSLGVKGYSAGKPHVQTEGLGKSIDNRHIWTEEGVQ